MPTKLLATVIENGDMFYQLQEVLGERELLNTGPMFEKFAAGILNEHDFKFLAKLNGLPGNLTGMKHANPFVSMPAYDYRT